MIRELLRSTLSLVLWIQTILCFLVLGLCFIAVSFFVPPHWLHTPARWVCRLVLLMAGQRIRQVGHFPPIQAGPYMYVFNHSSLLDTFIVISLIPEFTGAIGKAEQFTIPVWGWILRRWGAVPINRGELRTAIDQLGQVEAAIKAGRSLLISPEGTRSKDGRMLPFKKGPFHVALNTQVNIVPMSIRDAHRAKRKGRWRLQPNCIEVRIADPITPRHLAYSDLESLSDETRRRISDGLPETQRASFD